MWRGWTCCSWTETGLLWWQSRFDLLMTCFFFTFHFIFRNLESWHAPGSIRRMHDLYLQTPAGWSSSVASTSAPPGLSTPQGPSTLDTETRVPVISLKDGTRLAGEDAPKRKDLDQWLKEHPGFVADVGSFIPVNSRFLINLWIKKKKN